MWQLQSIVNAGVPVPLGMILGILVGGICGLINGILVTRMKLPPFIATLGSDDGCRGLALYVTNAAPVSGMPESFANLGNGHYLKFGRRGKRL